MKTSKKIFAALLAVMMIVMMIPITASAAETTYSVSLTGKTGYQYTIYKLADVDTTTFEFENADASVADIVNKYIGSGMGIDTPAVLAAADKATYTGGTTFTTSYTGNLVAGLYYVKMTKAPEGQSVTANKNSVFAIPYTDKEGNLHESVSFNLSTKTSDNTPTVNKVFTNDQTADSISEFIGKNISFTLTGSIVGSKDEKATKIALVDTMSAGIDYVETTSVKLTGGKDADGEEIEDKPLTLKTDYTFTPTKDGKKFTVALNDTILNDDATYSYTTLEVVYNAKLNNDAVVGVKEEKNTNTVELRYQNKYTTEDQVIPGPTKTVYTFDLEVVKIDGNKPESDTNYLNGAQFTLYSDEACTKNATNGGMKEAKDNGKVTYTGLAAGTYYLKETKAPAGFNLNNTKFTVVIADNGTVSVDGKTVDHVTVKDYPIVVPETGGMGTMIFTIVGLSLIACAGVLFVVVRRKKASK